VQTRAVEGSRFKLKSLVFAPSPSEMLGDYDDVQENALASTHPGLSSPVGMLTRILLTEPPTEADRH
jgi:hypothetical protein